jgi:hypothetical protein
MKSARLFLAATLVAFLAACASPPAGTPPLSPREQADPILTSYAGVLVAVNTAVHTPSINADAKAKIKAASHASTDAVLAYSDKARLCFRDPKTGVVGDAPSNAAGQHCDPTALGTAQTVAESLLNQTSGVLTAFGYSPTAAAPAKP